MYLKYEEYEKQYYRNLQQSLVEAESLRGSADINRKKDLLKQVLKPKMTSSERIDCANGKKMIEYKEEIRVLCGNRWRTLSDSFVVDKGLDIFIDEASNYLEVHKDEFERDKGPVFGEQGLLGLSYGPPKTPMQQNPMSKHDKVKSAIGKRR